MRSGDRDRRVGPSSSISALDCSLLTGLNLPIMDFAVFFCAITDCYARSTTRPLQRLRCRTSILIFKILLSGENTRQIGTIISSLLMIPGDCAVVQIAHQPGRGTNKVNGFKSTDTVRRLDFAKY